MRFSYILTYVAVLCFFSTSHAATNHIQYQWDASSDKLMTSTRNSLSFTQPPRIDQLVMQGMDSLDITQDQVDWINSRLFNFSSPLVLTEEVLSLLSAQTSLRDEITQYKLNSLSQFIRHSRFAKRLFISLDPDITRLNIKSNPKVRGHWFLSLVSQPVSSVIIIGNVYNPGHYQWHSRYSVRDYLKETKNLELEGEDVIVIQPDGKVEKHALTRWRQDFQEVAPGAILYLPFHFRESSSSVVPNSVRDLNQLIVTLLRNRLP